MNRLTAVVLPLVFLLACWGYSWIFLKMGLENAGPFTFAAMRTMVAGLFLLSMLPILKRPIKPHKIKNIVALGFVQTALFVGFSQWSLVSGAVGKTAILVFTMPFWVLIFSWFALSERIVGKQWLAVALAAVGLVLVLTPWQFAGSAFSQYIALAAGVAWGASTIMAKKIQLDKTVDVLNLTAWQMFFGSLLLSAVAMFSNEVAVVWNWQYTGVLAFTGVVSTGTGWLIWTYLLKHLTANIASMSLLAVPVIALIAGAIHYAERPTSVELTGMVVIIVALALVARGQRSAKDLLVEPL